jgi:hypothetical protein
MGQKRRRLYVQRCRRCRLEREPEETFWNGHCPACRARHARRARAESGTKLLAKAKDGGTVKREGQTFRVVVLPSRRRSRRAA